MILISRSKIIPVCETEDCRGRVFKRGNCDVVIKNLSFSDAGKYFMRVYYHNHQTELEQQIRIYQLHIQDDVSVKTGEELELDVLVSNADEVQHQSRRSTGWKKIWRRTEGVQSERISIRDRNLIISNFTDRATGTYRVLDPEGNILITVTVRAVIYWIMSAGLLVYTALLVSALVTLTIQKTLISKSRMCFTERGQRAMNLKDDLM